MKRLISFLLCFAVIISLIVTAGCHKATDNSDGVLTGEPVEYDSNYKLFYENHMSADALITAMLKDWGLDIGDSVADIFSVNAETKLDFTRLIWNNEDYLSENKLSPTLGISMDKSGKASVMLSDGEGKIGVNADKYDRFLTDGKSFFNIPDKYADSLSERLEGVDVITLLSEISGAYDILENEMKEAASDKDFSEDSETFTANGTEFSAVKKLTLTFDADEICTFISALKDEADENGELIKVLNTIDEDELRDTGSALTDTRYFDNNNAFIREKLTLSHTIVEPVAPTTTAPTLAGTTTTTLTTTTTTTSATTDSDTTTTTAPTEPSEPEMTDESYSINIYHYEVKNQRVVLVSGEYKVLDDCASTAAAFLIEPRDDNTTTTTTSASTDSTVAGDVDGKVGLSIKKTALDYSTWETSVSGDITLSENEGKQQIKLDGGLNFQVGPSSIVGVPFGFLLTIDSFDKDSFKFSGSFALNAYSLYNIEFGFDSTGSFNKDIDVALPDSDTDELDSEKRNEMISKLGDSAPELSGALARYMKYFDENGFLKVDKFDLALENSSQNQYIYFRNDLTGFIEEPFKYKFDNDKMITTDVVSGESIDDYDYSEGGKEGEIILGGNTYINQSSSNDECDIYQLSKDTTADYDKMTLYLYKNGTGVWHYNIDYRIVQETGEVLFIYLLSHEMSTATFLMNDEVCYLNAEPFTIISYGFNYGE